MKAKELKCGELFRIIDKQGSEYWCIFEKVRDNHKVKGYIRTRAFNTCKPEKTGLINEDYEVQPYKLIKK